MMSPVRRVLRLGAPALLLGVIAALVIPVSALGFTWGPDVQPTGPHQTMFDWSANRCEANNIPDAPAHALRDARGRIQVLVTHHVNYRLIGESFNTLALQCRQHLVSTDSGDPATFNNREWVTSLYTEDGHTIYALLSNEYQGNRFVGFCNSGNYFNCLYLSVTAAVSKNHGDDYTQDGVPPGVQQRLPVLQGLRAVRVVRPEQHRQASRRPLLRALQGQRLPGPEPGRRA